MHHGYAIGVLSGAKGRFGMSWTTLKELRVEFFKTDDSFAYDQPSEPTRAATPPAPSTPVAMDSAMVQAATVARIQPQATQQTSSATQLDMLVLFTEKARQEAGGNPSDCSDTDGLLDYVHQNVTSMDMAFENSQIPAQIGVVTVARLNGFTLIPFNYTTYDTASIYQNRSNLQTSSNIKAFRDLVGADVVSTLVDTQTNLGTCGVAYIQRPGCGGQAPGCGVGAQFSDWTYILETIQCTIMDTFTHELGHVLGAEHDRANTSATPATASFPYSFGYAYPAYGSGFETMMSQQLDATYYPTRLLQFSNPYVSFQGHPTQQALLPLLITH